MAVRFLRFFPALLAALFGVFSPAYSADVDIALDQFGIGSVWRAGDAPAAIRLRLTCNLTDKPAVRTWVQWEVPDADGDMAEYGREITLTAGRPSTIWLYAPLPGPSTFSVTTVTTARVLELEDDGPGRELGIVQFSPSNVNALDADYTRGMILQVGRRPMGLTDYRNPNAPDDSPAALEDTRIIDGVEPEDLPDRWYPFKSYEAVVWGPDALPQSLRVDTAAALRDYIQRGGHLVIVLPDTGAGWNIGAQQSSVPGELADLLPTRQPRRDESVPLEDLLPILSKSRWPPKSPIGKPITFTQSIRVFKELSGSFNAIDNSYEPLTALRDGRVVVIQRTFGHGRITMVGVDVSYGQLRSVELPHADVFWNRILGRRNDTPRNNDIDALRAAHRMALSASRTDLDLGSGRLMEENIGMAGAAGQGLGLAFLLFAAYLLVAAGSFFFLRLRKMHQHAWMVFVATAGVFTGAAWGVVSLARDNTPRVQHLTYIDHIARPANDRRGTEPQLQRVISWFNVFVPSYGRSRVSLDSVEGQRDLLLSWSTPKLAPRVFPNVDRYGVDIAGKPADYQVPGRYTAKQFFAHYLGPPQEPWQGVFTMSDDDPIRADPDSRNVLMGRLSSAVPGTLRNVSLIWVHPTRIAPPQFELVPGDTARLDSENPWVPYSRSGRMLNNGRFVTLAEWPQGATLNLREQFSETNREVKTLSDNIDRRYIEPYERDISGGAVEFFRIADQQRYMEMLSFFHQLAPPKYVLLSDRSQLGAVVSAHREVGRELDLSAWFSRPCLIIIGHLEDSISPLPFRLDGGPVKSNGHTIVRWIYPLEIDESELVPEPAENP